MRSSFFSSASGGGGGGSRLKREECKRTRHDSVFFKWEILIGSSDWEDHSSGKDGVQRYRIHSLPYASSCPGLYELGLAAVPDDDGRKFLRHGSLNIIVVYLGQTNNVRTRLQRYGRVGAHLESGKLVSSANDDNECSGLFKEIFMRGYSVVFRWTPMINKKIAEKTEADLLAIFDYAWNKCGNGACRRHEIVSKLDSKPATQISTMLRKLQIWKHPAFSMKAGVSIDSRVPMDDQKGSLLPLVLKFRKSQFKLVDGNNVENICGVAIGNGLVCGKRPVSGRKRCEEHKAKKNFGTGQVLNIVTTKENTTICGVVIGYGSICTELPTYGRKRCELHKGRRLAKLGLYGVPHAGLLEVDGKQSSHEKSQPQKVDREIDHEEYKICGMISKDGTMCRIKPVLGRKRCMEHKGQRVTGTKLKLPTSRGCWETKEDGDICGVVMDDYVCRRKPVFGRKRCEEHKGQRIVVLSHMMSVKGCNER